MARDEARAANLPVRAICVVLRLPLSAPVDVSVVDALARLELTARRLGGGIDVTGDTRELADLLELLGLPRLGCG